MALESSSSGSTQSAAWVGPTSPGNRIVALDVLRGFALLGILFVNIMHFSGVASLGQEWTGFADKAVQGFIQFFVRSKFLTMFAMLFGIGFAMQIARLEEKTGQYLWTYGRRLLVLLLFGVAHLTLDPAEVLYGYAISGAVLLLFRRVSLKALLLWALLVMPLPYLHTAIVSTLATAETPSQVLEEAEQTEQQTNQQVENEDEDTDSGNSWNPYAGERAVRVHSEGDLSEVLAYNIQFSVTRHTSSWVNYLWGVPVLLPLMLVGAFIGRRRIMERIHDEIPLLRKAFWIGLGFGIAGTWFSQVLFGWAAMAGWDPWVGFAGSLLWVLAGWSMALGYAAGIVLLVQRDFWKKCLAPLQAVGRLALTNYLLQTLICTTLFYAYGLGLYGKFGPATAALLAIAIYLFQVALSLLWTRRFRFGPAEWLWRSITYGRLQPMRIT
jgi:uncharacterized protein